MVECSFSNLIPLIVVTIIQLDVHTVLDHLQVSWGKAVR